jgi:hypothetical protein
MKIGDKFYYTSCRPWRGPDRSGVERIKMLCTVVYADANRIEYTAVELKVIDPIPNRKPPVPGVAGGFANWYAKELITKGEVKVVT